MVRIALNPVLAVQPRQNLLEELIGVALADTELGDPDGLVEGLVESLEVVLEVLGLVPGVVVSDNEVDLAVAALAHELLEPVDALVGFVAVGDSRRAKAEALFTERVDVLLVGRNSAADIHVGASTANLVWLVEAQDVGDLVFLLRSSNVGEPSLRAPLLVGVEERDVFAVDGLSIYDSLPIVHPGDLVGIGELMCPLGTRDAVVLLGKGKTTLVSAACLERRGISESRETSQGQKEG